MQKNISPILSLIFFLAIACNNANKKDDEYSGHSHSKEEPKTLTDSLLMDIDEGHIVGMSKIGKLHNTRKEVQRVLDSIGTLPAKTQQNIVSYTDQLNAVIKDLDNADFAMDKWMTEYSEDSAKENEEQRIKYLSDEKIKVEKMKEAILTGLQKADSLLKVKL